MLAGAPWAEQLDAAIPEGMTPDGRAASDVDAWAVPLQALQEMHYLLAAGAVCTSHC